jgi:O-antigen ligase
MLGLVAALGLTLELQHKAKSSFIWRAIMIASVLLAQSSMGYVAATLGALFVANRLGNVLRRLLYVAVPVVGLAALLDEGVSSTLSAAMSADEVVRLLNGRTGIWEAALQGFYVNPVFGYGPSLLDDDYRALYLPNFGVGSQAHSQWFQSLGEAGLVGAASLIMLAVALLVRGYRGRFVTGGLTLAAPVVLIAGAVSESPLRPTGLSLGSMVVITVLSIVVLARKPTEEPAPEVDAETGVVSGLLQHSAA